MTFSIEHFVDRVQSLQLPPPSDGVFYRSIGYKHLLASPSNITTGEYSAKKGGRYNPPNSFPVCYLAGTQTHASFEIEQAAFLVGVVPTSPSPRIIFGVRVQGAVLLDLCNPALRNTLGVAGNLSDIYQPSDARERLNKLGIVVATQQMGAAARAAGYDGVRFPAVLEQYIGQNVLPLLHNVALFMSDTDPATPKRASVIVSVFHDGLLPA